MNKSALLGVCSALIINSCATGKENIVPLEIRNWDCDTTEQSLEKDLASTIAREIQKNPMFSNKDLIDVQEACLFKAQSILENCPAHPQRREIMRWMKILGGVRESIIQNLQNPSNQKKMPAPTPRRGKDWLSQS